MRSLTQIIAVAMTCLLGCSRTAVPLGPSAASLPYALQMAKSQEVPGVLLYFWSPSCVPCRTFEKNVLTDPVFRNAFATLPLLRIQLDGSMTEIKRSLQYGVKAAPTLVVIDQSLRSHLIDLSVGSEHQSEEKKQAEQVVKRIKLVLNKGLP